MKNQPKQTKKKQIKNHIWKQKCKENQLKLEQKE